MATFETKMAAQLPGAVVFCGHRRSGITILMRRVVEYLINRPQSSDGVDVEVYTASPDPLWTDIVGPRVKLCVAGHDGDFQMSDALQERARSETRPQSHLVVVLQGMSCLSYSWKFLMAHACDYNVSIFVHCTVAPKAGADGFCEDSRAEDNVHAAVIAWDASPEARARIHRGFATSFGTQEEWEKHYRSMTGEPAPGSSAVVIEYGGPSNVAYGVAIPRDPCKSNV